MTTYRPNIKHNLRDPLRSLAEDMVQLEDVERLRLDNTYGDEKEKQKQLAARMKLREQVIQKIMSVQSCSHLAASHALHKAIERAIRRKES